MITATEIFCLNELGKRANNEDSVAPKKGEATVQDRLFVVCDGVGGEKKGEVASQIVTHSIQEYFKKVLVDVRIGKEAIQKAILYANKNLSAYVATDVSANRMSTTLAMVLLGDESVIAAWCGDSRIHHIRNGKVIWKSRDHSLVSELIYQGELSEEEARSHPQRNVITRSLNALSYNNSVDFHEIESFETGDYLLVCTDGFLEKVSDKVISEVLMDEKQKDKALAFFAQCREVTRDNFSMYLVRIQKSAINKNNSSTSLRTILVISFVVILLCFAYFFFIKGR